MDDIKQKIIDLIESEGVCAVGKQFGEDNKVGRTQLIQIINELETEGYTPHYFQSGSTVVKALGRKGMNYGEAFKAWKLGQA